MSMPFSEFNAARAPRAAAWLALAALLTACASPNPLMQEPAPVAKDSKPAPAPAAQTAATPSAVPAPAVQAPPPKPAPAQASAPAPAAAPAAPAAAAPQTATATPAKPAAPTAPAPVAAAPAPAAQPAPAPAPLATAPIAVSAPKSAAASPAGVETTLNRRFLGVFSPYRPDVQQGNFVSREMVAQLREGMTPDQVRFVLGTPLLTDMFHANRWDYVFRLQKGNGEVTTSRLALFFRDNRLARVEGGDLPDEKDYLARIAGAAPEAKPAAAATAPAAVPADAAKSAAPATGAAATK